MVFVLTVYEENHGPPPSDRRFGRFALVCFVTFGLVPLGAQAKPAEPETLIAAVESAQSPAAQDTARKALQAATFVRGPDRVQVSQDPRSKGSDVGLNAASTDPKLEGLTRGGRGGCSRPPGESLQPQSSLCARQRGAFTGVRHQDGLGLQQHARWADGSVAAFARRISSWSAPANYPGETKVGTYAYRLWKEGSRDPVVNHLYGYSLELDPAKTVAEVRLSCGREIRLYAASLLPATDARGTVGGLDPVQHAAREARWWPTVGKALSLTPPARCSNSARWQERTPWKAGASR